MNKLDVLKNMGFAITWKLISIGLYGSGRIPVLLTYDDVFEYLDGSFSENNEQTDNMIVLVCEENEREEFDKLLKKFSNQESSDVNLQKRKWRCCLLRSLIDNIDEDYFQGLLELMEFWVSLGIPDDCPQAFPKPNDKTSIDNYFSQESYASNLNKNKIWLKREIADIINEESKI